MVVVASAPDPPYSSGAGRPCRPTYAHRSHPRRENVEDGSRSRVSTVTFRASRVTVSKNSTCSGVAHSMTLAGRDFTTSPRGRPLVLDQPLHPGRDGADRLEVALVDLALVDGQLELLLDECDQLHEAHGVDEVLQQRRVVGHVDVLEQQLVVDERADAPRHVVGLVRFVHGLPPQAIPDQGPPVPAGATRSGARPGRDRSSRSVEASASPTSGMKRSGWGSGSGASSRSGAGAGPLRRNARRIDAPTPARGLPFPGRGSTRMLNPPGSTRAAFRQSSRCLARATAVRAPKQFPTTPSTSTPTSSMARSAAAAASSTAGVSSSTVAGDPVLSPCPG